jgi:hypothetical protein
VADVTRYVVKALFFFLVGAKNFVKWHCSQFSKVNGISGVTYLGHACLYMSVQ